MLQDNVIINMLQQPKNNPNTCSQTLEISKNKMIRKCLKTLMHALLHQYRSQSYDYNGVLSCYLLQIEKVKQNLKSQSNQISFSNIVTNSIQQQPSQPTAPQTKTALTTINDDFNEKNFNQQQYEQLIKIWPEIAVFIWQLASSPKWYVHMLKRQQIYAQEDECIDMHVFTSKIYRKVMSQTSNLTPYTKSFQQICADQIYFFLQEMSAQICQCFKSGQNIVINELSYVTSVMEKSEIINFYLLYKVFKDTSLVCRHRIIAELQQGLFRCIQADILQTFALYIIEKYQILDMQMKQIKPDMQQPRGSITQKIMNSNNVKWREAIRQDGQIGILVQLGDETEQQKPVNYMLMVDDSGDVNVVNGNSLNMSWMVCKKAQNNYNIQSLVKNKQVLAQKFRTTSTSKISMTLFQNVGVVGGSMGKCLAQIDTYDNVGDFMVSLSRRTIVGGSFNYLLMKVPLLSYIFITGGFTYTFYYIFANKYANTNKKMCQLRNISIGSAASIGSGIVGAIVGQSLIPLPILGAFIGGFVGGFLGQFGVRIINNKLDSQKFQQTIQQMQATIQPQGYWNVSKRTLKILEIKQQKFYQTIPKTLQSKFNCDRIWLTIILFTLLCFHQSKQRVNLIQKQMKQHKKQQQKMSQQDIILASEQMKNNEQYEPSIDYMCIIKYFENHQIIFAEFHDDVVFLLNNVFAKLK